MLEVKVRKTLPGFNLEVDFSTQKEILTILGPSGSGKTMTLKCIAGLVRPDTGYIKLNDRVLFDSQKHINLPPRQRRVGFVFQNYALFPHLTVNDNIAYGLGRRSSGATKSEIAGLLDKMHIQGLGQRYPGQLSSGQQQRVALARALFQQPEVLLLDEPFSALDTQRKEQLEYELLSLKQSYNGDMLFVTHDVAQGYKLGSRIAVFESGRIVQCDDKKNVIGSPVNRTVALLTGVKNLIEGKISRIDDTNIWVTIQGLGQLRIINKKTGVYTINQQVIVGIRPEYLDLTDHPGENTLPCMIKKIVEGVASVDCYLSVYGKNNDGYDFETKLTKAEAAKVSDGQSLNLFFPPEQMAIITKDTV